MLPVTHGIAFTRTLVLLYTVLLLAVCLLPWLVGMSGLLYLAGSVVLNLQFLRHAWRLRFDPACRHRDTLFPLLDHPPDAVVPAAAGRPLSRVRP